MAIQTISATTLGERLNSGSLRGLIDVRTPAEYQRLHARGARSVPMEQLDPERLSALRDGGEPVYLICQSGARSGRTCERLVSAGVSNIFSVEGGTAAWKAEGLPVERGAGGAISIERQVRIGAGALVCIGVLLGCVVSRKLLVLPALVGGGLVFAGVSDYCGMGLLLAKMPWNTRTGGRVRDPVAGPVPPADLAAESVARI